MTGLATRHALPAGDGVHWLDAGLRWLDFALVRAGLDAPARVELGGREGVLVLLEGAAGTVTVGSERFEVPARGSVFEDPPAAVYAPPGSVVEVTGPRLAGLFAAEAAAADAPAPYLVAPDEVAVAHRGRENFAREVRDVVPAARPGVRLLAGETLNPAGNWSSSPPHKHDRDLPPEEAELEEVYLFRVDPPQGFGALLSYGADPPGDAAHAVRDLDVVAIPRGYHPVVAGPGYRLYYLWGLAGRGRALHWYVDPDHAWVEGG